MSNDHSYERLCDYYRAKQEEIDSHKCDMVKEGGMLLSSPPKQKYFCKICGKIKYKKYS